jgi:hypothetical protein
MSQRLPPLPNLGHLKKQAKDVLRVSRNRSPQWRLADAQHALARGYGFPSWPDLKLHVESVRQQRGGAESSAPRLQEGATAANTGVAPNAAAQHHLRPSSCPMVGTWATRPTAGSEDHCQASIGDSVVEFELTDDIVTLTQIAVDPAGRELAMKMAIPVDGQDHPVQFGNELVLRAWWTDVWTLETIVKHGENIVSKGTYEVSADGQSLVVSTTEQRVVFKRV